MSLDIVTIYVCVRMRVLNKTVIAAANSFQRTQYCNVFVVIIIIIVVCLDFHENRRSRIVFGEI